MLVHLTNYWHELLFKGVESFDEPLLHVERNLVVVEVVDTPFMQLFVILKISWVEVLLVVLMKLEDLALFFAQLRLV